MSNKSTTNSVLQPATMFNTSAINNDHDIEQSLVNLDQYLQTWVSDQGLNGMIATWWSSTLNTIETHPMNQAPYILGLLAIHSANITGNWLDRALHEADNIIGNIGSDNLLENGWGDIPGAPKAPVIGLAAVGALYATADISKNDKYLLAGDKLLSGYENKYANGDTLSHFVSNQNARWALTKLQRYLLLNDENDLIKAIEITDRYLSNQLTMGPYSGGIFQSDFSDVLISVYGGKCIYPLVAMYETTGNKNYLNAAKLQAEMLINTIDDKEQLFVGQIAPSGRLYKYLNLTSKVERRISKKKNITTRLRRKYINSWETSQYPVYIARAADTIRGIGVLANHDNNFQAPFLELQRNLLNRQYETGGFPNSVGYHGLSNENHWQDIVPSSRWNAYVYQLLAFVVSTKRQTTLPSSTNSWPMTRTFGASNTHTITESLNSVTMHVGEKTIDPGSLRWTIEKSSGNIQLTDEWRKYVTGTRNKKQMHLDRLAMPDQSDTTSS